MLNGRRAGTLTAGITLVVAGALFLASRFTDRIDYAFILSLWPVVLILLGIEVIAAYVLNREDKIKYDGWAVLLTAGMCFFAFCMAIAEFVADHFYEIDHGLRIIY